MTAEVAPGAARALFDDYRNFAGARLPLSLVLMIAGAVAEGFGILMIVPLVIRREWKVLRTAFAAMLAGLLIPMAIEGPRMWWELLGEWGRSMLHHTEVMGSPDRFSAILGRPFGLAPSTTSDAVFIALAGGLLAWLAWSDRRRNGQEDGRAMNTAFELWLAMALVPNLVITDQQHFMFSLPLVLFILAYLFTNRTIPLLVGFIVALLFYATRSTDLWGKAENQMVGWGVLGSGNILLMAAAWYAWHCWQDLNEKGRPASN